MDYDTIKYLVDLSGLDSRWLVGLLVFSFVCNAVGRAIPDRSVGFS